MVSLNSISQAQDTGKTALEKLETWAKNPAREVKLAVCPDGRYLAMAYHRDLKNTPIQWGFGVCFASAIDALAERGAEGGQW